MNCVVAYDVNTETPEGRRRLRRVAKICEGFGQRVQYSIFELVVSRADLAQLLHSLESCMDASADSIRVYLLDRGGFDRTIHLGIRRELPHDSGWVL